MESSEGMRLDRWLWMVRVFRHRTDATEACRSGRITSGETVYKAASIVRPGMVLTVRKEAVTFRVRVAALPERRLSPGMVEAYREDLDPPVPPAPTSRVEKFLERGRGEGRPTKRERRLIDALMGRLPP